MPSMNLKPCLRPFGLGSNFYYEKLCSSKVALIALFICFTAHSSIAQTLVAEPQFRFQHFDTKDGLPAESIHSIAQDSLGFIWLGYYGSLTRFDGYTFKSYRHNPNDTLNSLPFGVIKNIWNDPTGAVLAYLDDGDMHGTSTIVKYNVKTDGFLKNQKPDFGGCLVDRNEPGVQWCFGPREPGLFRLDIKTGEATKYVKDLPDSLQEARSNTVVDISDLDSILLIASENGLWSFDKKNKKFKRPSGNPADTAILNHTVFHGIEAPGPNVVDRELWIRDNQKMLKLDRMFRIVKRFDFPEGFRPASFARDKEGVCWFTSWYPQYRGGLYRYDPRDNSFIVIKSIPGDESSLRSNNLVWVFVDRDQNVWTGGSAHGVSRLQRQSLSFYNYKFPNVIGATTVYRSREQDFVIVGRVKKFGYGEGIWGELEVLMAPIIHDRLDSLKFKSIMTFSGSRVLSFLKGRNNFWISAIGSPMIGLPIDTKSGLIASERTDRKTFRSSSGIMWEDQDENFWFARYDGLHKANLPSFQGTQISDKQYKHSDDDPNSIAGNSLYGIVPNNSKSFFVVLPCCVDLFNNERFEHVFSGHLPTFAHVAADSTLFIGAFDGLHEGRRQNGQYKFVLRSSLLINDVLRIQEDKLGRLWISTPKGIVFYDRDQNIEIAFNQVNGFNHYKVHEDNRPRVDQTSKGLMVMSDEDGVSIFNPLLLTISKARTAPLITGLKVNNQAAEVGNDDNNSDQFSIQSNISVLEELVLDYTHNNFSIEFSAMEMTAPEKNIYRHRMDGFDKDWIETDYKNRTASYTNLDAGTYTFRVTASNHQGVWSEKERTLKVTILPPPWKSTWAYMGYSVMFIGLLYAARKNIVQRERLKSNLRLAKVEQEKEHFELEKAKEVDKVKSTFFANISHEFRTPLTLIKGPVHELMEEFADHPKVKDRLKLVQRNADLVLKLINQLLDLAKVESGTLSVEKSDNDLNKFLHVVTSSFSSLAFQKNITLESVLPEQSKVVSMDKDKVETILINLINNAIKFTPSGGTVNVRAVLNGNELVLVVSDTGIGIEKGQQEKVFERFHQISEAHKEVGTGIGLSLVRELVALMKGTLSLNSELGRGSEFTVVLPVDVIREVTEIEVADKPSVQPVSEEVAVSENGHASLDSKPRVLVVEDNSDLRKFIISCLGTEFYFLEAADGKQGLQTAFDETPDLIISDVMMPEMDGITMTGKIKTDTRTSHIPLILLTAKTSDESRMSGLGTGADDYLTKPFNKNELLLKVRNSIALRVKLREKIKLELLKESPKVEVLSADEQFLLKVREAILARLSDEQLGVESLAEEIGLSRSQLFRKISALTGASVNELIRTFRLQRAAQLLEQRWGPVTQVAYEVGFSNLSYFSKVFKEQYGVMPSEYGVKIQ